MQHTPDDLTEAELAEWHYAHRDVLDEEEGEEVEADVRPQLSITISFRLPGDEADAIRKAARASGVSMSEWIRDACAVALKPDEAAHGRRVALSQLDDARRELEVLASRLDETVRQQTVGANVGRRTGGQRRTSDVPGKPTPRT